MNSFVKTFTFALAMQAKPIFASLAALGLIACGSSVKDAPQVSDPGIMEFIGSYEKSDDHIRPVGFTGTTYYVSASGSDSNDGQSEAGAFATIQKGADVARPGDSVLVMNGDYMNDADKYIAYLRNSGTPTNWIKYAAYPGHKPHIKVSEKGGFYLAGASYILIEGFKMTGPTADIDLEYAKSEKLNKSNSRLSNTGISLKPYERGGDKHDYSHHVVIQYNEISHFGCNGIGATRADYLLVQYNTVHDNAYTSPWACSGISTWSNWNFDKREDVYRVIFRNNLSYRNYNHVEFWMQKKITDGNGLIIDALMLDQGVIQDGYQEEYNGAVLVENNIAFENGGRGINIYHSDNVDIINNTTYHNAQHPEIKAELGVGKSNNLRFLNNVFVAKPDEKMFLFYGSKDITFGNNIFTGTKDWGTDLRSSTNWIDADPMFVDSENYDFRLKSGSPAMGAATQNDSAGITYDGKLRGTSRNLGAY